MNSNKIFWKWQCSICDITMKSPSYKRDSTEEHLEKLLNFLKQRSFLLVLSLTANCQDLFFSFICIFPIFWIWLLKADVMSIVIQVSDVPMGHLFTLFMELNKQRSKKCRVDMHCKWTIHESRWDCNCKFDRDMRKRYAYQIARVEYSVKLFYDVQT